MWRSTTDRLYRDGSHVPGQAACTGTGRMYRDRRTTWNTRWGCVCGTRVSLCLEENVMQARAGATAESGRGARRPLVGPAGTTRGACSGCIASSTFSSAFAVRLCVPFYVLFHAQLYVLFYILLYVLRPALRRPGAGLLLRVPLSCSSHTLGSQRVLTQINSRSSVGSLLPRSLHLLLAVEDELR